MRFLLLLAKQPREVKCQVDPSILSLASFVSKKIVTASGL